MTAASGSRKGCLKFGCLGCIAIPVLIGLVFAIFVGVGALVGQPEEKFERTRTSHDLPGRPGFETDSSVDSMSRLDLPGSPAPGRIELDLDLGSFEILPANPGEPIRVEANYDTASFELEEGMDPDGGEGWVYRVRFGRKVSWFRMFGEHTSTNFVTLYIPRDTPFALGGRVGTGESSFELGGLSLVDLDLDLGIGEHSFEFLDPLPTQVDRFHLDASIGELRVSRLGNASPRSVSVGQNIGEVDVDLRGEWRNDAEIVARCGIGECRVRVPRDVGIDIGRASVMLGESGGGGRSRPAPDGAPTLRLTVTGTIGEVNIDD